jgi:hypothetical protein
MDEILADYNEAELELLATTDRPERIYQRVV